MLTLKNILVFQHDPTAALDLAMAIAQAGGNVVGPATTVHHVRILSRRSRLDGAIYALDGDDAEALDVLRALLETCAAVVVLSDADQAPIQRAFPQVAVLASCSSHPVMLATLDRRIGVSVGR